MLVHVGNFFLFFSCSDKSQIRNPQRLWYAHALRRKKAKRTRWSCSDRVIRLCCVLAQVNLTSKRPEESNLKGT